MDGYYDGHDDKVTLINVHGDERKICYESYFYIQLQIIIFLN